MKSLAVIVVVNLVLSSSSPVVGMPRDLDLGFQGSLATRPTSQHSLFGGRLIETAPKNLFKREYKTNAQKTRASQVEVDGHDDYDNYNDDDDDDDTCEDSSDSSYVEDRDTPSLHTPYRIGHNSTVVHSLKSKSPLQNSSSITEHSSRPAKGLSQSLGYEPQEKKHHADSQKYDASSDNHASESGNESKRYGFMGYYDGYQGKATFFSQDGSAGACGKLHEDSDYVVAIQSQMYDGGKFCGKTVMVTRKSTGKSIKCVAADKCPGCPTDQSLDLSIAAFNALGNPDEGIFDIHWQVMD